MKVAFIDFCRTIITVVTSYNEFKWFLAYILNLKDSKTYGVTLHVHYWQYRNSNNVVETAATAVSHKWVTQET